jgi:hypothetical protein
MMTAAALTEMRRDTLGCHKQLPTRKTSGIGTSYDEKVRKGSSALDEVEMT